MLRKYRRKNAGLEPEPAEKYKAKKFFVREPEPEPPRYTEEPEPEPPKYTEEPPPALEPEPEPDSKDGWMKKDDFK